MKRGIRWLIWIIIITAIILLVKFVFLDKKPVPVHVVAIERGLVEQTITNTRAGTVKVRKRASLSPRTGGLVVKISFRDGDSIHRGDLLIKLDDSVQRAEANLARKDIAVAQAREQEACLAAQQATRDWKRGKSLTADGIGSEQTLDTLTSERDRTRAACEGATAAVSQSYARLELAEKYLSLTEIRAPFDGVVAELSTEVGEYITPAPPGVPIPPVIDLLSPSSIYVSAPIDEMDAERVQVGQKTYITVDSRQGERFSGRIARVAPYVLDKLEQNRTVEVEAEFFQADTTGILPGTSADVEVILERHEKVLRVPSSAVAEGGEVLVVEGDRLVSKHVKTGLNNWKFTEILDGLNAGEVVVKTRDSTAIKPGAIVTIQDEK